MRTDECASAPYSQLEHLSIPSKTVLGFGPFFLTLSLPRSFLTSVFSDFVFPYFLQCFSCIFYPAKQVRQPKTIISALAKLGIGAIFSAVYAQESSGCTSLPGCCIPAWPQPLNLSPSLETPLPFCMKNALKPGATRGEKGKLRN